MCRGERRRRVQDSGLFQISNVGIWYCTIYMESVSNVICKVWVLSCSVRFRFEISEMCMYYILESFSSLPHCMSKVNEMEKVKYLVAQTSTNSMSICK